MIGTLVEFRAYALERGHSVTADDAAALAALQRATDYITYHYVVRFKAGFDETSDNVEAATYEAALLELKKTGFFNKTYTPGEQKTLVGVEGIRWEVLGTNSRGKDASPVSSRIEAMLRPYLKSAGVVYPLRA